MATTRASSKGRSRASSRKPAGSKIAAASAPKKGAKVQWNWGAGKAIGTVLKVFRDKVTRRIKGASITRNGTAARPALLVKSDKGGEALKSASEVKRVRRGAKG